MNIKLIYFYKLLFLFVVPMPKKVRHTTDEYAFWLDTREAQQKQHRYVSQYDYPRFPVTDPMITMFQKEHKTMADLNDEYDKKWLFTVYARSSGHHYNIGFPVGVTAWDTKLYREFVNGILEDMNTRGDINANISIDSISHNEADDDDVDDDDDDDKNKLSDANINRSPIRFSDTNACTLNNPEYAAYAITPGKPVLSYTFAIEGDVATWLYSEGWLGFTIYDLGEWYESVRVRLDAELVSRLCAWQTVDFRKQC